MDADLSGDHRVAQTETAASSDIVTKSGGDFGRLSPSPSDAVALVVGVGSEDEVVGTDASGRVASVADQSPLGGLPVGEDVGPTMSSSQVVGGIGELAVPTAVVETAGPQPALVGLVDLGPEADVDIDSGTTHVVEFTKGSWRDSSNLTPQHEYDLRITDHYAPLVQTVLGGIVDHLGLPALLERLDGQIVKDATDDARLALARRARAELEVSNTDGDLLHQLLEKATADGYATGMHAAGIQLGAHAVPAYGPLAVAVADTAWDQWKPGNPTAVLHVADGALRTTLDGLRITIKDVTDTLLDSIGNRIGDGLAAGLGSDAIERNVRELVDGKPGQVSTRAERIVYTEVARAQTLASFDMFRLAGVGKYELLLSDGACEECVAAAERNPYQLGDDTGSVPIHPNCRCANSPLANSIDPTQITSQPLEGDQ